MDDQINVVEYHPASLGIAGAAVAGGAKFLELGLQFVEKGLQVGGAEAGYDQHVVGNGRGAADIHECDLLPLLVIKDLACGFS